MYRRQFLVSSTASLLLMRGCPAATDPAVFVTADTEAHVAVVAPRTGRVRARIATLEGPRSIEGWGDRAVVAHTTEGVVTLLERRRVRRVLRGFTEPRYTAISPDGRWAYVTDSARGAVIVVDLDRGRVAGGADVGDLARHITLSPDGRTLWVALGTRAAAVVRVGVADPARPRLAASLTPPFLAHDVACAPAGDRLWVTSGTERRLALYAPDGSAPPAILPAGAPPQHVTFADGRAYVASGDDGSLDVHRARDGRRLARTAVPFGSYNVQRGGGWVVTPSLEQGTLVAAGLDGRVVSQTAVAAAAHDACVLSH